MNHREIWKHTTAKDAFGDMGATAGVDLFDDELNDAGEPTVSVYVRFNDGTRFPARTITPGNDGYESCLAAWCARGPVNDYRTNKA